MKLSIQLRPLRKVGRATLVQFAHFVQDCFDLRDVALTAHYRRGHHGVFLDHHPQFEYLDDLGDVERLHCKAPPRPKLDQSLSLKPAHRFPDRHATDAKFLGDSFLAKLATRWQRSALDTFAEPRIRRLG